MIKAYSYQNYDEGQDWKAPAIPAGSYDSGYLTRRNRRVATDRYVAAHEMGSAVQDTRNQSAANAH